MAFSDDEEDIMPEFVTSYYFLDDDDSAISFTDLPIQFDSAEEMEGTCRKAFLRGTIEGTPLKVCIQAIAWKLGLEDDQPKIMVLSKYDNWINLLKPRKSYGEMIRTILIILQFIHFLKKNPEESVKSLQEHLCGVFGKFAVNHFKKNYREYISLIKLFIDRDGKLAKAPLLLAFLAEVGADFCDSVCTICDDGGELLCCQGRCMRSFHATESAGEDSACNSLGYSKAQVEAIQIFLCKNCQYNQHQCFACGKLGSSDNSASAEVFCCVLATCGRFYHPKCVAELLCPDNESEASRHQKRIAAGKSFTCPVHKCVVCRQQENRKIRELQFAMCRRCPKSYHRKCLPREIAFKDTGESIVQRAWDGLLPNCTLIYCLNHAIMEELGTPVRDHVIFPGIARNKNIMVMQKKELNILAKKKSQVYDDLPRDRTTVNPEKIVEKLQRYVQHGDTVVDFCCDANAFSQLMKEKLDATGKICHFHNYGNFQPKNDLNFEKGDWMEVKPGELFTGSKLVMVLNPPFGVEAAVINKLIAKALTFKPKLLILIASEGTERLDRKNEPYDVIWEDREILSGKSYLPESVDVNDHQMEQGNLQPPVLCLWSHPTWTKIYKDIAIEHGHTSTKHKQCCAEESRVKRQANALLVEECTETPDGDGRLSNKGATMENHEGICVKKLKSCPHRGA